MPEFRIVTVGPELEPALRGFLDAHRSTSMVLRSNLARVGVVDHGEVFQGTYLAAFEDERIVGVAALYWHGLLMLQAPRAASELAAQAVIAKRRTLTGIMGAPEQVVLAIAGLGMTDADFYEDTTEELFELEIDRMVMPVRTPTAVARPMLASERAQVLEWSVQFRVAMWRETETPEMRQRVTELVDRLADEGSVWVLDADGPVCCALFTARTSDAVQLGGVWTPAEQRGRGYAKLLVADMLLAVRESGVERAVLFTEYGNEAAQRVYRSLGFRTIGEYRAAMLD